MALWWVVHEWVVRLVMVRRQLSDDAAGGQAWLLRIRERVLLFLVSRYGESSSQMDERPASAATAEERPIDTRRAFCSPDLQVRAGGESSRPRRSAELRGRLLDIESINDARRYRRWRWWL